MPTATFRTTSNMTSHQPAYNRQNPFMAKMKANTQLNATGSGKDTRHIVIDISGSGITYKPGDSLAAIPHSSPASWKVTAPFLISIQTGLSALPRTIIAS